MRTMLYLLPCRLLAAGQPAAADSSTPAGAGCADGSPLAAKRVPQLSPWLVAALQVCLGSDFIGACGVCSPTSDPSSSRCPPNLPRRPRRALGSRPGCSRSQLNRSSTLAGGWWWQAGGMHGLVVRCECGYAPLLVGAAPGLCRFEPALMLRSCSGQHRSPAPPFTHRWQLTP